MDILHIAEQVIIWPIAMTFPVLICLNVPIPIVFLTGEFVMGSGTVALGKMKTTASLMYVRICSNVGLVICVYTSLRFVMGYHTAQKGMMSFCVMYLPAQMAVPAKATPCPALG